MATYSRGFLQAMMRPGYAQNLFQVGQRIGQAPTTAVAIEQEKEKKRQLSAFNPNTVEGLTGLAQYYQGRGDMRNAAKLATAAREMAANEARLTALTNRKAQTLNLQHPTSKNHHTIQNSKSKNNQNNNCKQPTYNT